MQYLPSIDLDDLAHVNGGEGANTTNYSIRGVGSGNTSLSNNAQCVADTKRNCFTSNQNWFQRNIWGGTDTKAAAACERDLVPLCPTK